jgi:hypothetical protein
VNWWIFSPWIEFLPWKRKLGLTGLIVMTSLEPIKEGWIYFLSELAGPLTREDELFLLAYSLFEPWIPPCVGAPAPPTVVVLGITWSLEKMPIE